MTDRERLLQTLAATYAYYDRELSQFVVQVWVEDLEGHPIDAVCAAFTAHRRDPQRGQWLPKTADILRQLQGDVEHEAQLAWGRVMEAATNGGRGEIDNVSRQALHTMGGISAVQRADVQQTQWLRKQFLETFAVYAKRDRDGGALLTDDSRVRARLAGVGAA